MTATHRLAAGPPVAQWHRPLLWLAVAMAILVVVSIGGMIVDGRVLAGLPIWAKSVKFALATLIYAVTWAWLIAQLTTWRRVAWWAGTVAAVGLGLELVVIVIQIVRGTTSHFNFTTAFDAALWNTMGLSIMGVWFATVLVAAALFRNPASDRARTSAIRAGAVLSVVGAALGMLMVQPTEGQRATGSSIRGAHTVGLADGGPGLPILGWSTVGGDLRIPHFLGMHALQAIPLVLIVLEFAARRFPVLRSAAKRQAVVLVAAASYGALLAVLTWQALRGQSVVRPDSLTMLAVGAIAIAASVAVVVIVRRSGVRELSNPVVVGGVR
ncbi:hypothetical protein [Nocardia sp. XZ_19_369]|uniref:hypothetical protein n=1 Tax=Nocardia sp. XZ_19_369 TaxID=2769487 RepID=UPI00188EA49A|nr:hypothetical protein [Nocardia sp. XZ_19_369]